MRLKYLSLFIASLSLFPTLLSAGTFTNIQEPMGTGIGLYSGGIAFGDIDNDGDLDLAITGAPQGAPGNTNSGFCLYRNDAGVFSLHQEPMGTNGYIWAGEPVFGDIDNDGDLDLIVSGGDRSNSRRLIVYKNNSGVFSLFDEPLNVGKGLAFSSMALGDYDRDGDVDLVIIGEDESSDRQFYTFENNSGTFTLDQQPLGINEGLGRGSVAFGDIDNDGDLDLAVAGMDSVMYEERFIIYRNYSGTFILDQEPFGINLGFREGDITFGDYDSDGDHDIIIIGDDNYGDERFIIYRNDSGKYILDQEPLGAGLGYKVGTITLGDINNDSDIDIVVNGGSFHSYDNNSGTFNQDQVFNGIQNSSSAYGDIDNDGDLDLAVIGARFSTGRFIIYENDESTLNSPPSTPTNLESTNINGYWGFKWNLSGDDITINNLMRYKIAYGTNVQFFNFSSTNIEYFSGQANIGNVCNPTGNYYQTDIIATNTIYWKVCAIDSAFKSSPFCTVQTASGVTNTIDESVILQFKDVLNEEFTGYSNQVVLSFILKNNKDLPLRRFSVENDGSLVNGTDILSLELWHDINKDGLYDSLDNKAGNLFWNGSLWTNDNITYFTQIDWAGKHFIITADLSISVIHSNYIKLIIPQNAMSCSTNYSWPVNPITNYSFLYVPQFLKLQEPLGKNVGTDYGSLCFGDIDNDGDLDLAICGIAKLIIYKNENGSFLLHQEPMGSIFAGCSIDFGDIDNDGDLDITVAGQDSLNNRRLLIFENNAAIFTIIQQPMGNLKGVFQSETEFGDIDNDGDLDLVVTGQDNVGDPKFIIYKNESGTFTSIQEPLGTNNGLCEGSITFGDIDNDGDLDLIVSGIDDNSNNRFIIYQNINNVFSLDQQPMGDNNGFSSGDVAFGDYNNDGDLDIVAGGGNGFAIYNNINGVFSIGQEPLGNPQYLMGGSLAWGDYDNDGDLDFIAAGITYGGQTLPNHPILSLYRNNSGTFNVSQRLIGINKGLFSASTAFGDIDNDGDIDLAVFGDIGSDERFIIYKNTGVVGNTAPQSPNGLSTTNANGYWGFKWNPPNDDHTLQNILRYKVAYGTNSNDYNYSSTNINYPKGQANIGNVCNTTSTFYQSLIPASEKISWKVCAIDSAFKHSIYSTNTSILPSIPDTPNILSVTPVSPFQIDITWNDLLNESSYTLFRATANDTNSVDPVTNFNADITNYSDTGLTNNRKYYYWLKAYNYSGSSGYSAVMSNTTPSTDISPPVTVADKDSGTYSGNLQVILDSTDPETGVYMIFYTLDGSNPTNSPTVQSNTSPLTNVFNQPVVFKFYSINNIGLKEQIQTREYEIMKLPWKDVLIYNNYLDLSTADTARIIFGKFGAAEIKIYNFRGSIVKEYTSRFFNTGDFIEWNGCYKETNQKVGAGVYFVIVEGDINDKLKLIIVK